MKSKLNQQGNVALLMVMILMTIGLLLLKALSYYQVRASYELNNETKYFSAFNLAESALAWGLTQSWNLTTSKNSEWECKKEAMQKWESCLKHYKNNQFVLLGKSEFKPSKSMKIYRWVEPLGNEKSIKARKNGWIDYCPVTFKGFCE